MPGSRYTPRQPDESVNVSKTHPLAEAGVLVAGLGAFAIVLAVIAVFMVDILILLISPEREARWFGNLDSEALLVSDKSAPPAELQALFDRIAAGWPESPYAFRLIVSDEETPNAMALPGGTIVVTSGLLARIESRNELGFVLAHELGHFHNRDHLRRFGRLALIGLVYSAASGSQTIGMNLSGLALRNFDRDQERQADAFGLGLAHEAFGHVNGAGDFFTRIQREDTPAVLRYFDTHPSPADRIDYLDALARQRGWITEGDIEAWTPSESETKEAP